MTTLDFQPDEAFAHKLDEADPLRAFRGRFHIPLQDSGEPVIYYCGNSLGLMPKAAREVVTQELEDWAKLAVDGHFKGKTPWYTYHEVFREPMAKIVGGLPHEVVMMNTLTVNLHLMMVTFYQPTDTRDKILMEAPAFPSDIYAIKTHLQTRGLNPSDALLVIQPRAGEETIRSEDIEAMLDEQGDSIALVLLAGVNFYTGQCLDMKGMTELAHCLGCKVGFDLAHAAGNVPLKLHDWNVDFAVWCTYKYLNGGPGSVAGCFIHETHAKNIDLPRYGGWWGNDPETRFKMHTIPEFIARPDADGWQISNPPVLSLAPLQASLALFNEAGMDRLCEKSLTLTGYLRWLIERHPSEIFEIITPPEVASHGCQLSILVHDHPRKRHEALRAAGVICDFREPNVIRVAPTPLYNTFHEAWTFADILSRQIGE